MTFPDHVGPSYLGVRRAELHRYGGQPAVGRPATLCVEGDNWMRVSTPCVLVGLLTVGCGGGSSAVARDSLNQRQRDSVIGASQLPGAQGVRGALRVSDSAAARREREDSVGP
jgi:hypothetical protein